MIRFAHAEWLYAIPLSLLVLYVLARLRGIYFDNQRLQIQKLFARVYFFPVVSLLQEKAIARATPRHSRLGSALHYVVLIVLLHLSLAQPYKTGVQLPEPPRHRDIVFLVDTSVSLVLRDYIVAGRRTDRMTMLKTMLNHFIDRLQGNRIGLIVFSEAVYTLVPLTTDYALLRYQINRLQPAVLTGRTTDVSRALLYALQKYKSRPQQAKHADLQKPVVVLISDVNRPNRDIDPRAVAQLFHNAGLRLHTITLGAASREAAEQAVSGLVYQPVNVRLMQQIADAAHGRSFWANSTENLQSALSTIQQGEVKKVKTQPVYIRHALYYWPLAAALVWLVLFNILSLARRSA